jgi:hypothetical protein
MRNAELALHFDELADLYELDGAIVHRILAYRNAAKAIREAGASVAEMTRAGNVTELPGIGKTIEEKLTTLLDTGSIPSAAGTGAHACAQALRRAGDRLARRAEAGGRGPAAARAQGLRPEGGGEHPARARGRGGRPPEAEAAAVEGASDRRGAAGRPARATLG